MSVQGSIGGRRHGELPGGTVFAGYRIERTLGRGGMGIIYLARELGLDRVVALKVIRPELADEASYRARFRSESRTAASIEHPRVVTVYGAGERDGLLYVAMRYIRGKDLQLLISAAGPLSPDRAAALIAQVAQGLDAVHAAGLVHRDVKPANVIVAQEEAGEDGPAYLTDFGLAKAFASTAGVTATGEVIGTLDYMAPEQIEAGRVDARTDVYALGCVLFHAVTGSVPFTGRESSAKLWAHINEPPPRAGSAGGKAAAVLDPVIRRAMAKHPANRFPSAGDLGRAALAAARGEAVTEPEHVVAEGEAAPLPETLQLRTEAPAPDADELETSVPTTEKRRPRKRRRRRWIAAVVVVLALGGLGAVAAVEGPSVLDGVGASGGDTAGGGRADGIEVPSLAGEQLDVAEQRLDDLGLDSERVGGGLFGVLDPSAWDVCDTIPAPGASARPGSTVRLLVDRPDVC
jgi:serine/threonine protein kinase